MINIEIKMTIQRSSGGVKDLKVCCETEFTQIFYFNICGIFHHYRNYRCPALGCIGLFLLFEKKKNVGNSGEDGDIYIYIYSIFIIYGIYMYEII